MSGSPVGQALPGNRWDLLDGVHPVEPPRVSVIVAHYRQPAQLERTLAALRAQTHPAERLQIVVADDGSPERPVVPEGVELVTQSDEGFRLAAVRNLGARRATGDVLVFIDADTAPEPDFVRQIARLPALAPDVLAVGRRRHAHLGDAIDVSTIESRGLAAWASRRELPEPAWLRDAYRRSADLLHADDRSYRYVIGAVMACSRSLFDATNGFDEGFTAYGGEDWEWAYRSWLAGALLAHVPGAIAWHDGPDIAGRTPGALATANAEALRLADLIPVPGSAGHGIPSAKVDIAVEPPADATEGQRFVAVDSAVAHVPGSAAAWDGCRGPAFDRVRVRVELLRPVRVTGTGLRDAVQRVSDEGLGSLELWARGGTALVRIVSQRAAARQARWGRDDLFPSAAAAAEGITPLDAEVDVSAYLGGWG